MRYVYNPVNEVTTVTHLNGRETRYEYDQLGRKLMVSHPDAGETDMSNDSTNATREMYWGEDNRLMILSDNGKTSRYTYNAAGERIMKSYGTMEGVYINGAPQGITFHETDNFTLYPASILSVNKNRFTKHYFIGDKRIASRIGTGLFNNVYGRNGSYVTAGQQDYAERMNQIQKQKEAYYKQQGIAPGVPTMKGAYGDPENTKRGYNSIIDTLGNHDVPQGWIQTPRPNTTPNTNPGPPVSWNDPSNPDDPQAGYGYIPNDTTKEETFFYHSDHLGSTSYITDDKANITQYDAYLPYGELLVDEHSSSEDLPYKFNGKQFDEETGLYYYGARCMNPKTSLWYGVDPLAEKYPNINPYAYAFFNPIKFIDPNGESSEEGGWIGTTKSNKKTSWEWDSEVDTESQARAKYGNVEFYKGGNKVFHESGTNKPFHLKDNGTWEYFSERNSANVSLPIILGESIVSDIALSTLLKFTGTLGMVLSLQGDSPGPNYKYFYRAMSASEYAKTNGYLMDTRPTGEGPHVRRDIQYLLNAKFINNSGKYDYIVQYMVKKEAAELFESTPFVFTPGQGKGGEIFNNARKVGLPYMKYEKGDFSYGFPGSKATTLFNSSLIGKPKIIHKIGTK